MKLYWAPRTCAIGIHVLLEEIGAPYTLEQVDMRDEANLRGGFPQVNPKGKVPALVRDDRSVLTEYAAIALWLARTYPEAGLWPDDAEAQARVLEATDYLVGTVHAQGFTRFFRPARFDPAAAHDETAKAAAQARGREIAGKGLALLGEALGERPYLAGELFTIADSALFYAERWIAVAEVAAPANILAHFERVKARPAVRRTLEMWGE
ncbi:glutathione S-transferase family protein [Caulobacter sp. S45]|uniref:glutathione S-transferase family protein n=1 Tax=Caulobacter sp. S45 TaxID=1641861 RepID=UPI00131B6134|nr:glutathione S-transferase C-terminal domain-containing protein [Caulobacter sp. S45]